MQQQAILKLKIKGSKVYSHIMTTIGIKAMRSTLKMDQQLKEADQRLLKIQPTTLNFPQH